MIVPWLAGTLDYKDVATANVVPYLHRELAVSELDSLNTTSLDSEG
jgi:hypothetical protein